MTDGKPLKANFSQLKLDLKKARGTLALVCSLPGFFRRRVTPQRAEQEIKNGLATRATRFLEVIRTRVYESPGSPYLKLLKHAGCEYSDLRTHVPNNGLEKTLERLATEGVYLTSDEFKGKSEVVRGSLSFKASPGDFDLRDSRPGFVTQSSGTNNRPIQSHSSIDWIERRTSFLGIALKAHDLFSSSHAIYDAVLPGAGGMTVLLGLAQLGIAAERWFARKIPVNSRLEDYYFNLTTYLIVLSGKTFGPGFPRPELIDIDDTDRIVRWVEKRRPERKFCAIKTVVSNAVRIARSASRLGVSLAGTKFIVSGEPFTEAKAEIIKGTGAGVIVHYGYGGPFLVGFGCGNPVYLDEMHVDQNMLAVVQHTRPLHERPPLIYPLLFTTLYTCAPILQLNVANGDYATLARRNCRCFLEEAGLGLHLYNLRSYEKFTTEGMNYFYNDLSALMEKTLPDEFGGGPGDYQLVEEEDNGGQTRLTLVVHPDVGELNEERLLTRLRAAFSNGSRGNRFMTGVWENAGTFRVKREPPYASPRGKILPLHISQAKTKLPGTEALARVR
jgi:hypothetical protein